MRQPDTAQPQQTDDHPLRSAVARRVAELDAIRPLATRRQWLARLQGVTSALVRGVRGNSRWGKALHGMRGGRARAAHGLEQLRRQQPEASRLGVIACERKRARAQWEKEHPNG